jgi:hypothetical protein
VKYIVAKKPNLSNTKIKLKNEKYVIEYIGGIFEF